MRPTEALEIIRASYKLKSNTGTVKGVNVLNYRVKQLCTGLAIPALANNWTKKLLHKKEEKINTYSTLF
jgi:hypothetical protein